MTQPSPIIESRGQTYGSVTDRSVNIPLSPPGFRFLCVFGVALLLVMILLTGVAWLLFQGIGVWGVNIPVAWGFAIINFVWWVGIGHAGTFISAILLLLRQRWRNSINRFAEAMTLFAIANAGLFPLLHLGRPWKFYYLLPYPSTLELWPQWRSPLVWDAFAVATYFTVSLLFWYLGLMPDLASMRDAAKKKWVKLASGVAAMGWRGSAKQWQRHQMLYLLLAGLATPLVISVHSIVSMDFAVAKVPGWHSTIFPPYFVAGAIFSGFALVLLIVLPVRSVYKLKDLITTRHLDAMAKVMLVAGLVVAYGYVMEDFTAWFSSDPFERSMAVDRIIGAYWPVFWLTMLGNVVAPQALWFPKVRQNVIPLLVVCLFITVGMWTERYMIIVQSLHQDFMPSAWGMYHGTIWDWAVFIGTLGFFVFAFMALLRLVPMVPISEIRELLHSHKIEDQQPLPEPIVEHDQTPVDDSALYGLVAEFDRPQTVIAAARAARAAGYEQIEAYTPMPLEELPEALGHKRTLLPLIILIGGITGGLGIFLFLTWTTVIDYPWNIGGRPTFSWPSFVPLTFELTILGGSLAGVLGFLIINRFPKPYHPISNTPGFERASRDRFFLCIKHADEKFDRSEAREFLEFQRPLRVSEVEL